MSKDLYYDVLEALFNSEPHSSMYYIEVGQLLFEFLKCYRTTDVRTYEFDLNPRPPKELNNFRLSNYVCTESSYFTGWEIKYAKDTETFTVIEDMRDYE